jgi:ABC-type transport system involved in cytochrome bd biosynthesis fused ATPase/permease subunit
MEWIKWWKDKTFLLVWGIILLTMAVAFVVAYFIDFGWILSIVAAGIGGQAIRRVIVNKLNEKAEEDNGKA